MNSLISFSLFVLPFICFVPDAYTKSPPTSQLLQKGIKHREMLCIYPQKHVSLIIDACCLRFNCGDTHLIAQRRITRFCFAADGSEKVQSPSLANLLFHFTERRCFALKEWQNNTDKIFLQFLSCLI